MQAGPPITELHPPGGDGRTGRSEQHPHPDISGDRHEAHPARSGRRHDRRSGRHRPRHAHGRPGRRDRRLRPGHLPPGLRLARGPHRRRRLRHVGDPDADPGRQRREGLPLDLRRVRPAHLHDRLRLA
ncbi:hypothetical protein DI270_013655 [Microbispora triticiradicis]|uniref:Uncharacterized protein n=1 Tax=Microbispora triticiradicis TaxID=2200763 RepID=A0ABX9LKN3_9ACTN|nr:hypothetical protein DI270_013655 [Microbispora triticiradicis]